jgi:hypothetical protein
MIAPYAMLIKIGAAIALALAIFAGGHSMGARGVQADWDREALARVESDKHAILAAVAANDAAHRLDIKQSQKVIADYEKRLQESDSRIDDERAAADRQRLRFTIAARSCTAAAGQAASPIVADGAGTEEIELPGPIANDLRQLAEDADRDIAARDAKIEALQRWARDRGFYGE